MDKRNFENDPDKIGQTVSKCPQKIKLKVLFKVFMDGPLFGKSVFAKTKSDIEKQVVLTELKRSK